MKQGYKSVRILTLIAALTAILETAKISLNMIQNVELVTLLVIVFTREFGWRITLPSVLIFVMIEMLWWGPGMWVISYFFVWPLLVLLTTLLKKSENQWTYILLSGAFGLAFGALCSVIMLITGGLKAAFAWWIAGIPYDLIHCAGNLVIAFVLFRPVSAAARRVSDHYRII